MSPGESLDLAVSRDLVAGLFPVDGHSAQARAPVHGVGHADLTAGDHRGRTPGAPLLGRPGSDRPAHVAAGFAGRPDERARANNALLHRRRRRRRRARDRAGGEGTRRHVLLPVRPGSWDQDDTRGSNRRRPIAARQGDPAAGEGDRSGTAVLFRAADAAARRTVAREPPDTDDARDDFRCDRAVPRRDRHLRRAGVSGGAAPEGDRHPPRARQRRRGGSSASSSRRDSGSWPPVRRRVSSERSRFVARWKRSSSACSRWIQSCWRASA